MLDEKLEEAMQQLEEASTRAAESGDEMQLLEDWNCEEEGDFLAPMQGTSLPAMPYFQTEPRYRKFSSVMDSGASDHVLSKEEVPEMAVKPSAGSVRGQKYAAAGGVGINNEGEVDLPLFTNAGMPAPLTYQVAQVRRPLTSIARLCDRGNRVTFGRGGGVVQNFSTGNCTNFRREGSIYMMDLVLDTHSPFGRQG